MTEPACRLYVILARDGRSAVVFRRGPTKQVLVLRWWLESDRLEPGQWFKGRIYERRCDLSPDGDLLIYFAAKWQAPFETWTAVSRTPYLTALALWPKGDAWGGGGLFETPVTIGLNHLQITSPVIPGARKAAWHPLGAGPTTLPGRFEVRRWSEEAAGRGEDNPVHHERIVRDGWIFIAEGDAGPYRQSEYAWLFNAPEIYERPSPKGQLTLRRLLRSIYQRNAAWYVEDFEVLRDGASVRLIKNCSWADWQANGDLLFALDGKLYRLAAGVAGATVSSPVESANLVADLAPLRFQNVAAPDWAMAWT